MVAHIRSSGTCPYGRQVVKSGNLGLHSQLCIGHETSDAFVEKRPRTVQGSPAPQASFITLGLWPRFFGSVSRGLVMDSFILLR